MALQRCDGDIIYEIMLCDVKGIFLHIFYQGKWILIEKIVDSKISVIGTHSSFLCHTIILNTQLSEYHDNVKRKQLTDKWNRKIKISVFYQKHFWRKIRSFIKRNLSSLTNWDYFLFCRRKYK